MKYSYPDLKNNPAAALEHGRQVHINKNDSTVAYITSNNSTFQQLNVNNHDSKLRVGIKFDNISARKYFALIHNYSAIRSE
jgi:hypothetical protein